MHRGLLDVVSIGEIPLVVQRSLIDEGQNLDGPRRMLRSHAAGREGFVGILEIMDGEGDLLQVVAALIPPGRPCAPVAILREQETATSRPMMAMTTSNSISVKADRVDGR